MPILLVSGCDGCNREPVAQGPANPAPPAEAPKPPQLEPEPEMSCKDFFSKADVQQLGFDPSAYDEAHFSHSGMPLNCHIGPTDIVVHLNNPYKDKGLRTALEAAAAEFGIKFTEGPSYGSETQWMKVSTRDQVAFITTDRSRAAQVVGTNKAEVEKVAEMLAKALDGDKAGDGEKAAGDGEKAVDEDKAPGDEKKADGDEKAADEETKPADGTQLDENKP